MACLQLEVLRQALVGSVTGWKLASVWRYAVVGLSSCPFDFLSRDGLADVSCACEQAVERVLHLKQFG